MDVASASGDGTVVLWDARAGCARATLHHGAPVRGLAFSAARGSTALACAACDLTVRLWCVEAHAERPARVPATTETRRSPRQSPPAPARLPRSPDEDSPAELWVPSTDPPRARPVPRARSVVVNDAPLPDDDDPAEMLCGALVGGE